MAGDWLKVETVTPDKAEVWKIAGELNIDPDAVVGKLLRVWIWFDQHTNDGNAPSVTKMLLDRVVGVTGFCDRVIAAGWMLDDGETITLPNFDRHNGKTAKNRALTAKRVAKHKQKSNGEDNEEVTEEALPREEKRREEKKNTSRQKTKTPKWTPEDRELAAYMLKQIREVAPSSKGSKGWPDHIRLMRERDGHSYAQIRAMFDWANRDSFWKVNILSPAKLREKWPQLEAKQKQGPVNGSGRNGTDVSEYDEYRKIGAEIGIHPGENDSERDYIAKVKEQLKHAG